ncbi:uncharacterized protein CCOS01_16449 [Colletotrichum costaricense]|uniref:Uncharacterized protein n=1 Tax=Colletotrichum costaricense TaxID=1209916 RepID=A0AAI9YFP8_9PEZI|nr:uncharacterized protein CCOS01_16449 [Colletotrichum costaricense]KAK1506590.1 hypothetical protein CCOS01_16449 [Colletotrichum costaricense]
MPRPTRACILAAPASHSARSSVVMLRLPASLYAPDATHSPFASWKLDVFSTQMAATKHRRAPLSKPLTHDYHTDDIKYNQYVKEGPIKKATVGDYTTKLKLNVSRSMDAVFKENSQDISRKKYQESCEDVKTKPSVRGRDPSLTVILEEIPSGALIWGTIEDLVGQDSDVCSYNKNDVSDNDKSSCDPCESFSKAKTKHNSNMDLHAVDLVHEDAPERLEARHVADVVVPAAFRETLAMRRFFKTSPTNVYSCETAAINPGALSPRSASTSPPQTTTHFMLSQAFLNISPLRLCGYVACFPDMNLSA